MSDAISSNAMRGWKLVQLGLTVRDLERAKRFYINVLGFTLLFETGGMIFLDLAGIRLLIGDETMSGQPPGGSIFYFDAPDLERLSTELEAKGIVFTGPAHIVQRTETHDLKLRIFRDPDGNALGLMGLIER